MPLPVPQPRFARAFPSGKLVAATPAHFDAMRRLLRDGARAGSFESELALDTAASTRFFDRLREAVSCGRFDNGGDRPVAVHAWVHEIDGGGEPPAGFAIVKALAPGLFELWLMGVDPARRRRGIGAAMLRALRATPAGTVTHIARVNAEGGHAAAMGRLLVGAGYACERTGREVDWYVHASAPASLQAFVRSAPAGFG